MKSLRAIHIAEYILKLAFVAHAVFFVINKDISTVFWFSLIGTSLLLAAAFILNPAGPTVPRIFNSRRLTGVLLILCSIGGLVILLIP